MSALRETQAAWRTALLDGDTGAAAATIVADGLAPAARLAIYRHHVTASLTELLGGIYPVVRRLVDPAFFAYAADRFIRATPPASPCLFEYGAVFADFLETFEPCRTLTWLPDVARLEWAHHRAWFADDGTPLDPRALSAVSPDDVADVHLKLDPSLTLLVSSFPVDEIWRANQPDTADTTIALGRGPVHLEVRRRGDDVGVRRLVPAAWSFRAALHTGESLGEAGGRALAADPAFDLAGAIRELLADDVLVAFTHTPGLEIR